jgi:GNAT superfamily N-acetyltransferase
VVAREEGLPQDTDRLGGDTLLESTLQELAAEEVLEVYARLLAPTFRPAELMAPHELASMYRAGGSDPSFVLLRDGTPIAVMLGEWYADRHVLLVSYLAVASNARGQRIGSYLLKSVLPGWYAGSPEVLVVTEVDDPRSWPLQPDGIDPEARLKFYERHGARLLPMRYFQPALRADSPRVFGMFLLRLDESPTVPAGVLTKFLTEYFTVSEGIDALRDLAVVELLSNAAAIDIKRDMWQLSRWVEISKSM